MLFLFSDEQIVFCWKTPSLGDVSQHFEELYTVYLFFILTRSAGAFSLGFLNYRRLLAAKLFLSELNTYQNKDMASKQTEKLKGNVEEQLERLVKQLEDLENYRYL